MEAYAPLLPEVNGPFKLLLFIDKRPNSTEQVRGVRKQLKSLQKSLPTPLLESESIDLEIVDVTNQPYLAEHFKLVATPALIKVAADTHQVLAGSDIASQLAHWWPRWQRELTDNRKAAEAAEQEAALASQNIAVDAVAQSVEILRLSDEIFRLKQDKETLNAQIAFKDRIISMMAHDLRNPLTAASIAIETLELAFQPGEKAKKFTPELIAHLLKNTKLQIRTVNRMITEILQTARGSRANLKVSPQALNLQTLFADVMRSFEAKLSAKHQYLDTDIPQDLPDVYADLDQVQRVLSNLIDNAIKYTPINGRIGIAALHRTTDKVQISIRDNGPGIPRDNQKNIFDENFRLQRDNSQDGYGLGLAFCQRVIRAHYGQIWVDSKQGEGSCFHFTLPVHRTR
ncbi:MAG: histidine kinase [Cyanobacteria bacterium J06650_10]